jgi:hypothetical protein
MLRVGGDNTPPQISKHSRSTYLYLNLSYPVCEDSEIVRCSVGNFGHKCHYFSSTNPPVEPSDEHITIGERRYLMSPIQADSPCKQDFHISGCDIPFMEHAPWPLVHKRTVPTERPPLVDEIYANLCG